MTDKEKQYRKACRETLKGFATPAALAGVLTREQEVWLGDLAMTFDPVLGSAFLGSACARWGAEDAKRAVTKGGCGQ
jgi:hypothetical protein